MSNSIQFDCHYCLNPVTAQNENCGREIPCPNCHTLLIVPSRPIDANLFDDIFESLKPASPLQDSERGDDPPENGLDSANLNEATQTKMTQLLDEADGAIADKPVADSNQEGSIESIEDEFNQSQNSLNAIAGKQSSSSNRTDEPLKIEGIDFDDLGGVLTVKCKICDSRIHTDAKSMDTDIECPICFTKIRIGLSNLANSKPVMHNQLRDTKLSYETHLPDKNSNEADSSSNLDDEYGLGPVNEETFSPGRQENVVTSVIAGSGSETIAESLSRQASVTESVVPDNKREHREKRRDAMTRLAESTQPVRREMTRREKYEAAKRRLAELEYPAPKKRHVASAQAASRSSNAGNALSMLPVDSQIDSKVPDVDIRSSLDKLKTMLHSPGLIWRAVLAGLTIGVGSGLMHYISQSSSTAIDPTTGERMVSLLIWIGMGLMPYLVGAGLLWLVCGSVFREAAQGADHVSEWRISSLSDVRDTFLLFSVSFFLAGLPLALIPQFYAFVLPMRFMIAPLLLLGAWYNQSPVAIVAVDAFKNFRRESNQWGEFYMPVVGLAITGFIGGLLLMIPFFVVSFVTSLIGAMVVAFATISFAAIAGWHCGEIAERAR